VINVSPIEIVGTCHVVEFIPEVAVGTMGCHEKGELSASNHDNNEPGSVIIFSAMHRRCLFYFTNAAATKYPVSQSKPASLALFTKNNDLLKQKQADAERTY
jgi:hypothetical protein